MIALSYTPHDICEKSFPACGNISKKRRIIGEYNVVTVCGKSVSAAP